MLVVCRLAGLSALAFDYAVGGAGVQSGYARRGASPFGAASLYRPVADGVLACLARLSCKRDSRQLASRSAALALRKTAAAGAKVLSTR
jgi:hypothetical protein